MRAKRMSVLLVLIGALASIRPATAQSVVPGDVATARLSGPFGSTFSITAYGGPLRLTAEDGAILGPTVCVHYSGFGGPFDGCGSAPLVFDPLLESASINGTFTAGTFGALTVSLVWTATGDALPAIATGPAFVAGISRPASAAGTVSWGAFTISSTSTEAGLFRGVSAQP